MVARKEEIMRDCGSWKLPAVNLRERTKMLGTQARKLDNSQLQNMSKIGTDRNGSDGARNNFSMRILM